MEPPRLRLPGFGPRGEGWVAGQFVILGATGVAGLLGEPWPRATSTVLPLVSGLVAAVGVGLIAVGSRRLGRSLSPFPRPVPDGVFHDDGLYRFARHPVYGGALLTSLGWALWSSPLALLPTALLALLLVGKSSLEEAWLTEVYEGYPEYRRRVRRRFLPGIW